MAQAPDEAARDVSRRGGARGPWVVLAALALGAMMDALDSTVVAIANPSIGAEFGTTLDQLEWVTNGYMLATAAFLITAGKFGDTFGHRRVFLIGVVAFVISSVLAGLATGIGQLIVFRVLQGASGSLLIPTALAIIAATFPEDKVKSAFGVFMGSFAIGGASGPFVGGLLVQHLDWRWVFFVNVALGAIAFAVTAAVVPRTAPAGSTRPFDAPGVALLTIALTGLVWAVVEVPEHGWLGGYPVAGFATALVAGAAFVYRETTTSGPFLPLDLFRRAPVVASALSLLIAGGLMFGSWFYLALYLQQVRGFGPVQAGLALMPVNVVFLFSSSLAGHLNQRFGPRLPVITGFLLVAVALAGFTNLTETSSYHAIWPFLLALSVGVSFIGPATQVIVGHAPPALSGIASGLGQTALMFGSVLSIAVLGTVIATSVGRTLPGELNAAGVPGDVAAGYGGAASSIAQGSVPVPPGVSPDVASAIVRAGHAAFMDGFRLAALAAAGVVLVSALLGLLIRTPPPDRSRAA
ncbi:DHA2 family efflux MFS transporter permease subunit [Umezawaea sp. NPDC059074]|uniref:DHA2 family efflux MFS transporter permease subunit n=1 Tax=Umezawaea sp. NPDC059074 TaxID=3346716 RepID=UPI00369F3189